MLCEELCLISESGSSSERRRPGIAREGNSAQLRAGARIRMRGPAGLRMHLRALPLLCCCLALTSGMYEEQAGVFDWCASIAPSSSILQRIRCR